MKRLLRSVTMRNLIAISFSLLLIAIISIDASAQCAMCGLAIESNTEGVGSGINNGIMFIMVIPYILIGTIGYFIYRNKMKNQEVEN